MKAVVIEKPHSVALRDVEVPKPPKDFVRVKVKAAAICATDLEVIDGNIAANYPLIPGHEWSGIVDEAGEGVDKSWIGKRVVGSNDVVCLKCDACREGEWRYCKDFEEIGFKRNGAYGEYVIVPAYGLCELPDNISFEEGALCEPVGVALGSMKKAKPKLGQTCVIIGAGSIGLCFLTVAKAMGLSNIVVCARGKGGLEIAEKIGASAVIATKEQDMVAEVKKMFPDGVDLVIDATGAEECIQNALKITRKGGKVVLAGYGRGKVMQIRIDDIHINNLHVIGAGNNWNMHKKAVSLLKDGAVDVKPLISEIIDLEDFEKGLDMARNRPDGFVKAVFKL